MHHVDPINRTSPQASQSSFHSTSKLRRIKDQKGVERPRRTTTAPSIPYASGSYRYQLTEEGLLHVQRIKKHRPGPGDYNSALSPSKVKGQIEFFKSGVQRRIYAKEPKRPGPNHYFKDSSDGFETFRAEKTMGSRPSSVFVSKSDRWEQYRNNSKPGPGKYGHSIQASNTSELISPQFQCFGTRQQRHDFTPKYPDDRTMYDIRGTPVPEKQYFHNSQIPFSQCQSRGLIEYQDNGIPGPGEYVPKKKKYGPNMTSPPLAKRFLDSPFSPKTHDIPGPCAYQSSKQKSNMNWNPQSLSSFASKVSRFPEREYSYYYSPDFDDQYETYQNQEQNKPNRKRTRPRTTSHYSSQKSQRRQQSFKQKNSPKARQVNLATYSRQSKSQSHFRHPQKTNIVKLRSDQNKSSTVRVNIPKSEMLLRKVGNVQLRMARN